MINIKCSISSCSYYKNENCFADSINIGGKGAKEETQTCCGTFLNKSSYSNLAEFTQMRGQATAVECNANCCKHNSQGNCLLSSINIGGNGNAEIYTETNCQSFEN